MLCAYALAVLLSAQTPTQPDFSGRWVLVAPEPVPADVPSVLVIQQHVKRTDMRGNPMQPFWDLLMVEGDDSKSRIRSSIYDFGVTGSMAGGVVGRETSRPLPPTRRTQESVAWQDRTLVITSEEWMQGEGGKRESYQQHKEVWALDGQGRLVITATDNNHEARTGTFTY